MISKPCSAAAAKGLGTFLLPPQIRSQILLSAYRSSYSLQTYKYQQSRLSSSTKSLSPKVDKINASSTTLPAPLHVPEREKGQGTFKYALKAGKTYLTFYKTGIKNIYQNYQTAKKLKQKLNKTKTPQLPPSPSITGKKENGDRGAENVYTESPLTRAESQLLLRSKHDINRVPIFALLFAVVGEWLPLIVIFLTPIVPYTCRIPSQIAKTRKQLEERRKRSFRGQIDGYIPTMLKSGGSEGKGKGDTVRELEDLENKQVLHICRSLGLHSSFWDLTKGVLPGNSILKYRLRKHLQYLEQDDALLVRDGSIGELNKEELLLACEQRGVDILGRKEDYLKDVLERWIKGRREGMVLGMLLSR